MRIASRRLRILLWVFAATAVAVPLAIVLYHPASMQNLARNSILRVGMQDSPPWYSVGEGSRIDGPVFEIIQEAARRRSLETVWVVDAAGPEHALGTGIVDLWPLMGRLPSRLAEYPITGSWMDLSFVLGSVFPCDASDVPAARPRTIAHRGTGLTGSIVSSKFPGVLGKHVSSHAAALRALCSGEADAALISESSQSGGAMATPSECSARNLCLKAEPVTTVGFGVGSRPGSPEARAGAVILRAEIDRMIDDGTLSGILLRWGVSSGEIRALRSARLAQIRANLLTGIAVGLVAVLLMLTVIYRRLLVSTREREQAHAELRQSQANLQAEFERSRDLEERYRQSQRLESLGRLAGGIAHDFNNLLTVINGYSEILLNKLGDREPRGEAVQVLKAGKKAAELTSQLLAVSRKQVIQPRPLDLNAVVRDTTEMLRPVIGEDVELITTLHPALHLVLADPGQLSQVLLNLSTNARDALGGGGKLLIETDNVFLDEVYATRHPEVVAGAYVLLAVSDTGGGMDQEMLRHIFDPFFTTKSPGKGTGLGLAIVYGIVRQAGGNIWVYSEPAKGTTFKIYLPAVNACPTPHVEAEVSVTGGGSWWWKTKETSGV